MNGRLLNPFLESDLSLNLIEVIFGNSEIREFQKIIFRTLNFYFRTMGVLSLDQGWPYRTTNQDSEKKPRTFKFPAKNFDRYI